LFIPRYELVHVTETQVREQVYKLYSNMYKQLFDVKNSDFFPHCFEKFLLFKVFDYQDAKWNQLMMHRTDYVRKERELLIIFEENF